MHTHFFQSFLIDVREFRDMLNFNIVPIKSYGRIIVCTLIG